MVDIKIYKEGDIYIAECNIYPSMKTHGRSEVYALRELVKLLERSDNNDYEAKPKLPSLPELYDYIGEDEPSLSVMVIYEAIKKLGNFS